MSNEHLMIRGDGLDEARAKVKENLKTLDSAARRGDATAKSGTRTLQVKQQAPGLWRVWFEGEEPISKRTTMVEAKNEKAALEEALRRIASSGFTK